MRALLALLLVLASGCISGASPGSTTVWDQAVKCAVNEGGSGIADVSAVLLEGAGAGISDQQVAELEQLAITHGTHAVSCWVQQLINDWTTRGAAPVPERLDAAERGRDFLRKKGITVQSQ